jgi:glycine oxidase
VTTADVAVVGAGIIGLSIAWRCAQRGLSVRVIDPSPGAGASYAAAGMLASVGESTFGEEALTGLLVASARRWPTFATGLAAAAGGARGCRTGLAAAAGDVLGYRTEGTLTVALTADDLAEAARLWEHQRRVGLAVNPERPTALREREPALSPRIRGGAVAPDDHQVDPRRVVAALTAAVAAHGVRVERQRVGGLDEVDAGVTVVAAGCATAGLTGLPVRPVKGQILRLRDRQGQGARAPMDHTIRGYADGRHVYLVPRADGEVVVGATSEELADDRVTVGGVLDLLRAATDLVPELAEFELVETLVRHRPATPDNAPVLGRHDGVIVASGHHRHGVLLAPVTADLITDLILGEPADPLLASFAPDRFMGETCA